MSVRASSQNSQVHQEHDLIRAIASILLLVRRLAAAPAVRVGIAVVGVVDA